MSLKKIAQMTGSSVSTVSRVLNDPETSAASKERKEQILDAARQIGYIPNKEARNLRLSKTSEEPKPLRFSIVFSRIPNLDADPFFNELFKNLEHDIFERGALTDQVLFSDDKVGKDLSLCDGVIVLGRCGENMLNRIRELNQNIVGIWRNSMHYRIDEVICDGKKAAETAMEHLFSLGHSRIAYIGSCSNESRYDGYCESIIRRGLPLNLNLVRQTKQTAPDAKPAFSSLMAGRDSDDGYFSAVFCANDTTAISVLEELKKEKKSVREQISVISIDNLYEAQNTDPMLSTIDIPRKEMSHLAISLLIDRIGRGHTNPVQIEFPCRLINRGSCRTL
ncbi:MAG: LacI family transcriptional regulator [Lachnospiraceae bacterium]|nr:LacI family transcriptional regulator [Lachnospiraceae bacterium]